MDMWRRQRRPRISSPHNQPRFLCLALTDDEYAAFAHQSDGDYQLDGMWLCGFHWIDRRPDNLSMWMERAADALESFS
jgi:hypothetical protein